MSDSFGLSMTEEVFINLHLSSECIFLIWAPGQRYHKCIARRLTEKFVEYLNPEGEVWTGPLGEGETLVRVDDAIYASRG